MATFGALPACWQEKMLMSPIRGQNGPHFTPFPLLWRDTTPPRPYCSKLQAGAAAPCIVIKKISLLVDVQWTKTFCSSFFVQFLGVRICNSKTIVSAKNKYSIVIVALDTA